MVVDFSNYDTREQPVLILKNAAGESVGVIGYAKNVSVDLRYNETSTLSFEVPAFADGTAVPYYDLVTGMRVVEMKDVGQFILVNPEEIGDGIQLYKSCSAYSLEYEFVFKNISLPKDTYNFWNPNKPDDTLLQMIIERMPSWSIGSVPETLENKWRTYEVSNENCYNFMKNTVQESYNCLFDFDTMTRTINVIDVSGDAGDTPVFISTANLAQEIKMAESTEDIVTRLDVNGAEGVDIRDVNPTGTNMLINMSYYMNESNFSTEIIEKYNEWYDDVQENKSKYYNLSVEYSLETAHRVAEMAALTDLKGELTGLENQQAVIIQGIANNLKDQDDLDEVNDLINDKRNEVTAKESSIAAIEETLADIMDSLRAINADCDFKSRFTDDEYLQVDRFLKDGSISESGFVIEEVDDYNSDYDGAAITNTAITITDASVEMVELTDDDDVIGMIYDIRGGELTIGNVEGEIVSAVLENKSGSIIMSVRLGHGEIDEREFDSGCVSITGTLHGNITTTTSTLGATIGSGYRYFTFDVSEYEKRSVAWDLYQFGEESLAKLSQPSFTFGVTCANFLSSDEFEAFKNKIRIGRKIYLEMNDGRVLEPILTGIQMQYDNYEGLELMFGDTFVSSDSSFKLVDLLNTSISMGKNVELSKYAYSAFIDSGASKEVKSFMTSALDVAKNALMSSGEQAVSWDGAGLRLRKYSNEAHTAYNPKQIWMVNNSILMTDDGWDTAKMAIGEFVDSNGGACWGIVAPAIVGTLLAGNKLVIESEKRYGDDNEYVAFRVDEDGCRLYNADFEISNGSTDIVLSPELGFVIGDHPVYTVSDNEKEIDTDNAKFYADTNGDLHLKGSITATELNIVDGGQTETIDDYISDKVDVKIEGKTTIYYGGTEQSITHPSDGDMWYDTTNEKIKRYNGIKWVDITDSALKKALDKAGDAQATADGKIRTFAQTSAPTGMAATDVGDLWIDTDDNNKLYRWSGTGWVIVRDATIDKIKDGTDGIYFSSNNVTSLTLNKDVGLKIVGADNSYFQVMNNAMGFFSSNKTGLLYYEDGSMYLTGNITANTGYIGGTDGWHIASQKIYSGSATTLGSGGGIYIGTDGISINSVIEMKSGDNGGEFIIRYNDEDADDADNYILKVIREPTDEVYKLYIGNVKFNDGFILPIENGGTGGVDRKASGDAFGLFRAESVNAMNSISTAINGDLCVIYSSADVGVTMSGSVNTTTTVSPGYLPIGNYNEDKHKNTVSYFGMTGMYWNVRGLSGNNNTTEYARVGRAAVAGSACALFIPVSIDVVSSTPGLGVTSLTMDIIINTRPPNVSSTTQASWDNPIAVEIYKPNQSSFSLVGKSILPTSDFVWNSGDVSKVISINCTEKIVSGLYYIIFYPTGPASTTWIKVGNSMSNVVIRGVGTDVNAELYVRSGNAWVSIRPSGGN